MKLVSLAEVTSVCIHTALLEEVGKHAQLIDRHTAASPPGDAPPRCAANTCRLWLKEEVVKLSLGILPPPRLAVCLCDFFKTFIYTGTEPQNGDRALVSVTASCPAQWRFSARCTGLLWWTCSAQLRHLVVK